MGLTRNYKVIEKLSHLLRFNVANGVLYTLSYNYNSNKEFVITEPLNFAVRKGDGVYSYVQNVAPTAFFDTTSYGSIKGTINIDKYISSYNAEGHVGRELGQTSIMFGTNNANETEDDYKIDAISNLTILASSSNTMSVTTENGKIKITRTMQIKNNNTEPITINEFGITQVVECNTAPYKR